jgi:lysophospholipase L1-like esterase
MKLIIRFLIVIELISIFCQQVYSQGPIKIMPIGNSITMGWMDGSHTSVNQLPGYRYKLKQLLQAYGYNTDFVGSESCGSDYFADCQHAGIGGSRDQYVARLLIDGYDERNGIQILNPPRPYLDEYNPDIILLHIGTNDVTHEDETELIGNQQVSHILDLIDQYEIRSGREVIVFLALIINRKKPCDTGSGCYNTTLFNNAIKAMALARIAAGDKIVIVDMEHDAGFAYDATDMVSVDNIHPNATGYIKMANLWYSSIVDNFNTAPAVTIPDQTLEEGGTSNSILLDNYVSDLQDSDQNIGWSVTQLGSPKLNITINENREVSATPLDAEWSGTQTAVFTATDNGKNGKYIKSTNDTVLFTVTPVNDAPFFTSNPVLSVDKGQLYNYVFSASDIDSADILQFSVPVKPDWLIFYPDSKLVAGIPTQPGDFPVTIRVNDGHVNTDQPYTIEVVGQTPVVEVNLEKHISVFPNPVTDHFMLLIPGRSENIDFRLFDPTGRPVLNRMICKDCEPEISIGQENLLPGVYFYKIILEKDIYTGKLQIIR